MEKAEQAADAPSEGQAPSARREESRTDGDGEGRTHPSLPAGWIVGGMTAFRLDEVLREYKTFAPVELS